MSLWGGLGCCIGAAVFYLARRSNEDDADVLKSVTRVYHLKDLAVLLDTTCKVVPLVVAVSGRVFSETPIHCKQSGLKGVIVNKTAVQHFEKKDDDGKCKRDSVLMLSRSKEVPWYLNDGTGRVFVVGARGATDLALTLSESRVFLEPGSLKHGTLGCLPGLTMLGVTRTESVLPTGTPLTVVGEALKDDIGTIRIQQPHIGPFYVTPKNLDQLISDFGSCARFCQVASIVLACFGVFLLAGSALQHILERKRHREWEKRAAAAAATAAARRQGQDTEDSDDKSEASSDNEKIDREPGICVVCLEQEYDVVFVPCGHLCCCTNCCSLLTNCPLCRRRIDQSVKTFRH